MILDTEISGSEPGDRHPAADPADAARVLGVSVTATAGKGVIARLEIRERVPRGRSETLAAIEVSASSLLLALSAGAEDAERRLDEQEGRQR